MPPRPTAEEMRAAARVLDWLMDSGSIPADDHGHAGHFVWLLREMASH